MTSDKNTTGRVLGRERPRGYVSDYRPIARVRALLGQVQEVLDEYDDYLPLTTRQIFYRLVGAYGYEKTEPAYKRLSGHLVNARRARVIPFAALRDDGVTVMQERWFADTADFWDDVGQRARRYERDKQLSQPVHVELWTEAAGMMPQLARVAEDYSVPVYSCSGFASLSAVRLIVDRAYTCNVPTVLLHVGDFDPSGEAVFKHLAEDAAAFLEHDRVIGTQRIVAERVALTAKQVAQHDLSTSPPKPTDSRSATWRGETCQAEALPPDVLGEIVRDAIEHHLDLDLLAHHEDTEQLERTQLLTALPRGEA